MRGARGARREDPSMDEVEEMLRAAEDDLLLNLTRNSHSTARRLEPPSLSTSLLSSSSSSPSPLDADLAARFDALKLPAAPSRAKQSNSTTAPSVPAPPPPAMTPKDTVTAAEGGGGGRVKDEWSAILGDDLNARFAALKGASSAANISSKAELAVDQKPLSRERKKDSCDGIGDVSENEVEKILQWAMDAARLEPSSAVKAGDGSNSSEDDGNKEEEEKDSDDEDPATDEKRKRPTGTKAQPKGIRPKKWFFF